MLTGSDGLLVFAQWGLYFHKVFYVLDVLTDMLPDGFLAYAASSVLEMRKLITGCQRRIKDLQRKRLAFGHDCSVGSRPTIFDRALRPESNKLNSVPTKSALMSDAFLMWLAGTDTTANTLVVRKYEALMNPVIQRNLRTELRNVGLYRDGQGKSSLSTDKLQSLPYLSAFVKDFLRLSYGAPGRLPRIVPSTGHCFQGVDIPPGTIVSHSHYIYHSDENVFTSPNLFAPERWLQGDTRQLDHGLLPFSKGSRSCLGIHLAYAEIFLTFARLWMEVDMRIHDTTDRDMEWGDYSVCLYRGHLRVKVQPEMVISNEVGG